MPHDEKARLCLAFSPCPNDTFIFEALIHGRIAFPGGLPQAVLADVETLNGWARQGLHPVTKLSFAALGCLRERYALLTSGAALGRGCGPLLVGQRILPRDVLRRSRIAVPGMDTTATFLLRYFLGSDLDLIPMPFETILPAIRDGAVDLGLVIHEGRFVFENYGLECIQDLGAFWEESTGQPIPLGGIALRRDMLFLAPALNRAIRESILYAMRFPEVGLPYITAHAQEMDKEVLRKHIALYVNDFSVDLGEEGKRAVSVFLEKGEALGLLPPSNQPFMADG
jgi:1,4-dihydroxy-6-naphthoate synthase